MDWLKHRSPFLIASAVLGILMLLFILLPILGSITGGASGLYGAVTNTQTVNAIFNSFYCAFLATVLMLALGVPFAYIFGRKNFMGKRFLDAIIDIPILIPHNTAGLALLFILTPNSPIGKFFGSLGITFVDTIWGIVVAMAFVSAPFMIRSAQEAFSAIDPSLEKVARGLGANQSRLFRHVTLPLASKGIMTGCVLTWTRSVSEFGAVVLLASYPYTAPVYVYDVFGTYGLNAALPINALLILVAIAILVIFKFIFSKPKQDAVLQGGTIGA